MIILDTLNRSDLQGEAPAKRSQHFNATYRNNVGQPIVENDQT